MITELSPTLSNTFYKYFLPKLQNMIQNYQHLHQLINIIQINHYDGENKEEPQ